MPAGKGELPGLQEAGWRAQGQLYARFYNPCTWLAGCGIRRHRIKMLTSFSLARLEARSAARPAICAAAFAATMYSSTDLAPASSLRTNARSFLQTNSKT